MTSDLASPAGEYYVCKTYFIVVGRKYWRLAGTNQFRACRAYHLTSVEKYLKERHPRGGII